MAGWFLVISLSFFIAFPFLSTSETATSLRGRDQVLGTRTISDERVPLLRGYLQAKVSPLTPYTAEMIATADKYQFDWRLLPAIAGKESSFGKKIPWDKEGQKPSYNAWGWGIYGDQVLSFESWEEAIEEVAEGLREEYYNKGYITPELIMKKFTPRSDGSWVRGVKAIMGQIAPAQEDE